MRRCLDCGADISARDDAAYLCLACGRERVRARDRRRERQQESRAAYHNAYYYRVRRAKLLRYEIRECPTPLCGGSFRVWGQRTVCKKCQKANHDYARVKFDRMYRKRKAA